MKNLELLGQQVDLLEKEEMKNIVGGDNPNLPCPPGTMLLRCSVGGNGGLACGPDPAEMERQLREIYGGYGYSISCVRA